MNKSSGRRAEDPAPEAVKLSSAEEAALSERTRLLRLARAGREKVPPLRLEKVERLREEIRAGCYQIPYERVIRRVLSQVRMNNP